MTKSLKNIEVKNTSRGVKSSSKTNTIRRSVVRVLSECTESKTTNDIAKEAKQSKLKVSQALRWLEQKGYVERAGYKKAKEGTVGRTSIVWKVSAYPVDKAEQKRVRETRAFLRKVCEMSPLSRAQLVHQSLAILAERQTDDEIASKSALHKNLRGFTKADSYRGVVDATKEKLTQADVAHWLSNGRIQKYRKQVHI